MVLPAVAAFKSIDASVEQAVQNLDEIVSVAGIDAFFCAFADYAASIGLTGQIGHARIIEARDALLTSTKRVGVAAGYAARDAVHAHELAGLGFRAISVGSDAGFMSDGAYEALAAAPVYGPPARG